MYENSSLYIAFFDVHRGCGGKFGEFCDYWGNGSQGMGKIPDWTPVEYKPEGIQVPHYHLDTPTTGMDIAAQYRSVSRMDQGFGLYLKTLKEYGYENNTLMILIADNGIPFPSAKTNLYDSAGMEDLEPMIISNPMATERWGQKSSALISTVDIVPTVMDWFGLEYPEYRLFGLNPVILQGRSLLPILKEEPDSTLDLVYSSHNLHGCHQYYPMQVVRGQQYRLVHNLNFKMPYPIATNVLISPTYLDILNRTSQNVSTNWFKTLDQYYYRSEFELFYLDKDPLETKNLIDDPAYSEAAIELKDRLLQWQNATNDPWLCMSEGELEVPNGFAHCSSLHNRV